MALLVAGRRPLHAGEAKVAPPATEPGALLVFELAAGAEPLHLQPVQEQGQAEREAAVSPRDEAESLWKAVGGGRGVGGLDASTSSVMLRFNRSSWGGGGLLPPTSLMQHPPVNAQVLAAAVLLEHSDLVPHAVQLRGETHTFAKVHHVYRHSALVDGAPRQRRVLNWRRKNKFVGFCIFLLLDFLFPIFITPQVIPFGSFGMCDKF